MRSSMSAVSALRLLMVLIGVDVGDVDANCGTNRHNCNGSSEDADKEVGNGRLMLRAVRIKVNIPILVESNSVFHVSCSCVDRGSPVVRTAENPPPIRIRINGRVKCSRRLKIRKAAQQALVQPLVAVLQPQA